MTPSPATLSSLATRLTGELHFDRTMRALYATDASEYQEMPVAVALPKSEANVRALIAFAHEHGIGLIPRSASEDTLDAPRHQLPPSDQGRHRPHHAPSDRDIILMRFFNRKHVQLECETCEQLKREVTR